MDCKQAAFVDQPSARNTNAIANITRSGVISRVRPISACRPTGPPTTFARAAPNTSVRLGQSRLSALRRSAAKGSGEMLLLWDSAPVTAAAWESQRAGPGAVAPG
ncbi:Uncharacterised protein [Mycobacterium tuberculosis]|uniref:Uncharacterized protein n=1 Tax=Mycobacterium tuberculosis TaxID=1773 RepID=A0A654T5N6_MYCTX|nr:Uncharacterised protein [Mycobacterium tuberculosis]CKO40879.1 Uncharacterised protein [Mycobacterium tuberculosis]CKQ85535.1 Uncharacterised protein [Mycobacterium tuberculosis]CKQ92610.1 Uncharacterised protein [Mycobacterium tuberculosis]CKR54342.1 Uncharacterised protein [Mycobacterium tuberculosis]